MASQSGFQSIYGGRTLHPFLEAEQTKARRLGRDRDTNGPDYGFLESCAPLMAMYSLMLIGGIAFGFLPIPGLQRVLAPASSASADSIWRDGYTHLECLQRVLAMASSASALALLLLQVMIGLPLERRTHKAMIFTLEQERSRSDAALIGSLGIDMSYTAWFWLGLLSLLLAIAAVALAAFVAGDFARMRALFVRQDRSQLKLENLRGR